MVICHNLWQIRKLVFIVRKLLTIADMRFICHKLWQIMN